MKRILLFRPSLADGGADRITITLLRELDRKRFLPAIALVRAKGELVPEVPADVPIIDLGASRLALSVPALARAIRSFDPDIVACTAGGANVFAVAAHRAARSRARLVLSERSALRREVGRSQLRTVVELAAKRVAYRLADTITAVSDGVADDLVATLGLSRDRVRVVYNPLVGERERQLGSEAVSHPWFTDGRPTLLAVGRLVSYKDYPTMLAAFRRIHDATGARLAVLGKGPLRDQLEQRSQALGIAEHVAFLGFDPNPYRYLTRATAVVQSSLVEGLPGSIVQAMACGTPVIATDCDHGPREVIRDGVDGYLVPVGDAAALAARTIDVLTDSALRDRLATAAVQGARRFEVTSSMARYEAAFDGSPA